MVSLQCKDQSICFRFVSPVSGLLFKDGFVLGAGLGLFCFGWFVGFCGVLAPPRPPAGARPRPLAGARPLPITPITFRWVTSYSGRGMSSSMACPSCSDPGSSTPVPPTPAGGVALFYDLRFSARAAIYRTVPARPDPRRADPARPDPTGPDQKFSNFRLLRILQKNPKNQYFTFSQHAPTRMQALRWRALLPIAARSN